MGVGTIVTACCVSRTRAEMDAPLRVLHVVRPAEGGIRQHVISLITHAPAAVRHAIAAPDAFLHSLPLLDDMGSIPLAIAAHFAPHADWQASRALARLTSQFDIVHAHGLRAGWVASLASLQKPFPLIVTAHNMVEPGGLTALGLHLIGRRALTFIAVSGAVRDGLVAAGVPARKIEIIPNGVDVARFAAYVSPIVPTSGFTVGCIARLSPEKGVDVLCAAAARLPHMIFLIAGDGPMRELLERKKPANVRLLGRIDDTRALLATVDILAVPSRLEGQGLVALEGMAAGVPLAASRVGGLGEMLADGQTALLIPSGDADALAAALTRLERDPALRDRLRAQGRALVEAHYNVRQMADAVIQVYERVRR